VTAAPRPVESPGPGGDWPHTRRPMPWLIAGFVVMLWLVPFDAIDLPITLPMDSKLDRFVLGTMLLVWLFSLLSTDPGRARLRRPTGVDIAAGLFVVICVASVLLNVERIAIDGELELAIKKIALLVSFVLFYAIVSTSLRAAELRSFSVLIVALAAITAVGIVIEYRVNRNLFFEWPDKLLPASFDVGGESLDPRWGRRNITGPTSHGLAATAILAMALPFGLIGLLQSRERRSRILYAIAVALILTAAISTLRKTAVFAPAAALLVLLAYRPRGMVRLLPLGLVIVFCIQVAAPGALSSIRKQLQPSSLERVGTVQDRVSDYDAIRPDLRSYPALGRGYGTYDHEKYRLLDNQYLNIELGIGYLGLAAYIALWMSMMGVADYAIRGPTRRWAGPALGASSAALVFGVVSALFDVMAFPHVPYLLLFCAAMAVVASRAENDARAGAPAPAPVKSAVAPLRSVFARPGTRRS
jgi:hypothetical protein